MIIHNNLKNILNIKQLLTFVGVNMN